MLANSTLRPSDPGSIYTDVNSLQGINKLGRSDQSAALREVAEQFESMFLSMMLSSMRKANEVFEEDSMLNSPESDFYRNMYDSQMAVSLAGGSSTGLANVIYRQLMSSYGDDKDSAPELDFSKIEDRRIQSSAAFRKAIDTVEKVINTPSADRAPTADSSTDDAKAASGKGNKGQQFASAEEFVATLYPLAEKVSAEIGVDAKAIVAQAALETGWGKHMITDEQGRNSFNFFGITADSRWPGESVTVTTHEYRGGSAMKENAAFRSYASIEDGLRDYADFLSNSARYEKAIGHDLGADQYGHVLQQAGYATDPQYGHKIQRISESTTLNDALQKLQQSFSAEAVQE